MSRTIVDLSRKISHMMPVANPHFNQVPTFWSRTTHHEMKGKWAHADISFHIRDFLIGEHIGTHLDSLCHIDPRPGALDIADLPMNWLITDGICIDVSHVKPMTFISVDDLKKGLQKASLSIEKGDTLLYWQNYYARETESNWLHEFAGLDWDATSWLADQGVINIGCECASIDNAAAMPYDANPAFPAHRVCRDRGLLNTENLANLEKVLNKRFMYVGLPLPLVGGTGSPLRAVAILNS